MSISPPTDERVKRVRVSDDTLTVDLADGRTITAPIVWFPRLLGGTPQQRARWKIAGGGYGIHWPDLDEDLSVAGLLRGTAATKHEPPSAPGRAVGSSRTKRS